MLLELFDRAIVIFKHIVLSPGGGRLRIRSYLWKSYISFDDQQSYVQGCRLSRSPFSIFFCLTETLRQQRRQYNMEAEMPLSNSVTSVWATVRVKSCWTDTAEDHWLELPRLFVVILTREKCCPSLAVYELSLFPFLPASACKGISSGRFTWFRLSMGIFDHPTYDCNHFRFEPSKTRVALEL